MFFTFHHGDLEIVVSTLDDSQKVVMTIHDPTEDIHYETVMNLNNLSELKGMLSALIENLEDA